MNVALAVCLALLAAPPFGSAQGQQDKEKLRTGLKDTDVVGNWIYDDLDAGFAEAKKSGKPMMIVFR